MTVERRDQLAAAYEAAFDGWTQLLDDLEPAAWTTPTGCPGWDAKDQLSHVVAVERILLGDPQLDADVPDGVPYVRHDFGRFVEVGVRARRGEPVAAVIDEARETFARRLAALRALDPAWLDQEVDGPYQGMRMRGTQLLRTRIYDVTTHEYDVRRAVSQVDAPAGAHLASLSRSTVLPIGLRPARSMG
jgi:uncharacterized protein (TIGR03083 family)